MFRTCSTNEREVRKIYTRSFSPIKADTKRENINLSENSPHGYFSVYVILFCTVPSGSI